MRRSNQSNFGTQVSQLPNSVECDNCSADIREGTAFGDSESGFLCHDCHEEVDLMLDLVEEIDE